VSIPYQSNQRTGEAHNFKEDIEREVKVGPYAEETLAGRVLLGAGIAGEIEPPDELEPGVLIRGKVHSVYAGPGTGKTMFMLWAVKRCLDRGEAVVVFDMENGPRTISERLRDLEVEPEQADRLLHYFPSPSLPMTVEARATYEALLEEVKPALVVFDSWINFLAASGMDENSSNDVAGWAVAYTHPARNKGITVLLLDHVPHEGSHARGSTRKKDEVDVMWRLHNTQPFDRDSVGEIVLHRDKDREAWLPPSIRFSVGGSPEGFVFRRSAGTLEETADGDLTDRQHRALDALKVFGVRGARYSEWQRKSGLTGTTFDRAISALTVRGLAKKADKRYFARSEPTPPRGAGVENALPIIETHNPRVPPPCPHTTNGGGGDDNPHNPHTLKGGGSGGNSANAGTETHSGGNFASPLHRRNPPQSSEGQNGLVGAPGPDHLSSPAVGSAPSVALDGHDVVESGVPGEDERQIRALMRRGFSESSARAEVLAKDHPLGCGCEVCA
jgi:hypothetical protein